MVYWSLPAIFHFFKHIYLWEQILIQNTRVYPELGYDYYHNESIKVTRTTDLENLTYGIYRSDGKLMQRGSVNGYEHTIDVRELNTGLYILNVTSESDHVLTRKFTVVK